MLKRQEDQVYFFCLRFTNFVPTKEHLKKIDKNSYIYALISKESVTDMFISEFSEVAKFDSPVKCFIYQGKISLSSHVINFSIKLSDLTKNNSYFIKIFLMNNHGETELTFFKFFLNKYFEVQQMKTKNYCEENFFQKTGARVQTQVFFQKNRAALQMLILDLNDENKRRQSLSARKKRQEKKSLEKTGNALTIQKLYKESKEEKDLIKTMQRAEIKKSTQGIKRKKSNLSQLSSSESGLGDPEINMTKINNETVKDTQKRDKSLITSRKVNDKHNRLNISRISEVINSENGSDPQKGNPLESFSREREKMRGSEYRKKSESSDPILQRLDLSQPFAKKALSVMTEQIHQQSSLSTGGNKKGTEEGTQKGQIQQISSIEGESSQNESRSYIEAVDLESEDSNFLTHSSENSARSQIQLLVERKNKLFWGIAIAFFVFAIYYLIVPNTNSEQRRAKVSHKKGKHRK